LNRTFEGTGKYDADIKTYEENRKKHNAAIAKLGERIKNNMTVGLLSIPAICLIYPILMGPIRYIPEAFNDVRLAYNSRGMNPCSPYYPDGEIDINTISINVPEKIICTSQGLLESIIPVCATLSVSDRITYKYYELNLMIHIRAISEDKVYSGEVIDEEDDGSSVPSPGYRTWLEELLPKEIRKAQKYSDKKLDKGEWSTWHMNLNAMTYVQMPLPPDKYEVWMTFRGLESNHCIVEIIEARELDIEETDKKEEIKRHGDDR
jgi:hypothetical protein